MAVIIFMFLVTIIVHSVTSDLQCWECEGQEDDNGKHPCDDRNNFKLIKCKKDEKLCVDLLVPDTKFMLKFCESEQNWNQWKISVKDNVIMKKCDTTECNTKKWEDYKLCMD